MPVLINFKICDNSKDCNGIKVCPNEVIYWDEENKTLKIDNSKCTICGACENCCPVEAIKLARTDEEYEKIKKEIDEDPRKVSDLFVDRYGATSVDPAFLIPENRFDIQILESTKLAIVELFNGISIKCLLHSIPIKMLFEDMDVKYRKIKDENLSKKYEVEKLPALLFFENGKLIGKIEGYFGIKDIEKLKEKTSKIIKEVQ